jgi:hypothetical protein
MAGKYLLPITAGILGYSMTRILPSQGSGFRSNLWYLKSIDLVIIMIENFERRFALITVFIWYASVKGDGP